MTTSVRRLLAGIAGRIAGLVSPPPALTLQPVPIPSEESSGRPAR